MLHFDNVIAEVCLYDMTCRRAPGVISPVVNAFGELDKHNRVAFQARLTTTQLQTLDGTAVLFPCLDLKN